MPESTSGWTRHFAYRVERTRTTWRFRAGLLTIGVLAMWLTSDRLTLALGRALVCEPDARRSDAILVENFDPDYLLFERARELRSTGLSTRVLVPVPIDPATGGPNDVAVGITEVMARLSRVGAVDLVPFRQIEPISLNAAQDVQHFVTNAQVRSLLIVTPLFRSRRSALVYDRTLGAAGVAVRCVPVRASRNDSDWIHSWHGIQNVVEQWGKLLYYRLYVLPFRLD